MQKTLGQKIKHLRRSKNLTQGELGHGLVTPSMISQIEADKASPSLKLLAELADRLGVSLDYFLNEIQAKTEVNGTLKSARALMEAGKFESALKLLLELLNDQTVHCPSTEIRLDVAQCLEKTGKTEEALALYDEIHRNCISRGEYLYCVKALRAMGQIEFEKGNLILADFHWNKAAALGLRELGGENDLLSDVLLLLARSQNRLGSHADALETLKQAKSILQDQSDAKKTAVLMQTYCEVHRDLGLYKKAEEYAQDAISLYKSLNMPVEAVYMTATLAQILDENGRSEEALNLLRNCFEQSDSDVMENISYLHSVIARIFMRLGMFDEAQSHCEKVLVLGDNDHDARIRAYRTLSEISFKREQYSQAIYYCEQLIQMGQLQNRIAELARSFALLSGIYKQQGNYASATETFLRMQKVVETNLREITVS
ncbi:helix-turn-helix domain-containing protein [Effusibacillus lacus]|uniref:HTH cro/C1-type domain-containing protein n=1 Tax=Effusibacillus lacus TaxID=1348429 RepID=A0A292YTP7_9BACL|nr:helix-turn-helix transcriptional regulator [Effusibacillus lacus]TCS76314.1 transcriptional regulator with XRE-family HTH domain [Effusibacillus lacus]GAX91860.1 hypothetical protein EFBL_3551 [Effusibacillus lacus]